MNRTALAFGIGAAFLLAAGSAGADCLSEVQSLEKQIVSAHKAASPGFGSEATTGLSGDTSEDVSEDAGAATAPTTEDEMAAPASEPVLDPAPGTAEATTAPASDPALDPAPGTGEATESADSTAGTIEPGSEVDTAPALVTLEEAETLAASGDEDACMRKLGEAKQQLGMAE